MLSWIMTIGVYYLLQTEIYLPTKNIFYVRLELNNNITDHGLNIVFLFFFFLINTRVFFVCVSCIK